MADDTDLGFIKADLLGAQTPEYRERLAQEMRVMQQPGYFTHLHRTITDIVQETPMPEYSDSLTRALLAEEAARPQPKPIRLKFTDPMPPMGSVLMIESTTGTAVQRFYSDGLYHATTGATFTFEALFRKPGGSGPREVYLIYRAPEED